MEEVLLNLLFPGVLFLIMVLIFEGAFGAVDLIRDWLSDLF